MSTVTQHLALGNPFHQMFEQLLIFISMVLDFADLSHAFAYSFIEQIPTRDLQCRVTGGDFNLAGAPHHAEGGSGAWRADR